MTGSAALVAAVAISVAGCTAQPSPPPVPTGAATNATPAVTATAPAAPPSGQDTPSPVAVPAITPDGTALDAGAARPIGRSVPVRLQVPAIGVDSSLMDLGLKADGTMEVPPTGFPAGWYTGAPTPGEQGPAIIAGHVDLTGPGVFYDLHKLRPEDQVIVGRKDGSVARFRVTRVKEYAKAAFPTDEVYGDLGYAGLRLITCGGSFNRQTHHYEDNIVAFAELVGG